MKITYATAWRVWYIPTFGQWVVHPPDGFYTKGLFTFLTNTHAQYFAHQKDAWNIAKKHARKYRGLALLHYKDRKEVRLTANYREDKSEEVQATECPKYLYP